MERFTEYTGIACAAAHFRCRHRSDHSGPLLHRGVEGGLWGRRSPDWRRDPDFVLNRPGLPDASILVAGRTSAPDRPGNGGLGVAGLRLQGRPRPAVRGHLPRQFPEERAADGDVRAVGIIDELWDTIDSRPEIPDHRRPGRREVRVERCQLSVRPWTTIPLATAGGYDDISLTLATSRTSTPTRPAAAAPCRPPRHIVTEGAHRA